MAILVAVGPDGSNLLGYLSALGAFRALDAAWPDRSVRLSWTLRGVSWRPALAFDGQGDEASVVAAMFESCRSAESRPELTGLGNDLSVTHDAFRRFAIEAVDAARPTDRRWADMVAAFGCEIPENGKAIDDTALRTMSGAGHQHFLGSMRELAAQSTVDDLHEALFERWRYSDGRPTMRWDPVDDRRYALRADDPATRSAAPIRTVRGANRLAIEALPFFTTAPSRSRVRTTAFRYRGGLTPGRTICWPIWEADVSVPVVGALIANRRIVSDPPDRDALAAIGVVEIFAATRVTVGKMRNFTPAIALLGGGGNS